MTSRRVGAAASCALVVLALASLPVLTRLIALAPPRLTGDAFHAENRLPGWSRHSL